MIAHTKWIEHRWRQRIVLFAGSLLISSTALAVEPNPQNPELMNAISQMREKQEAEEGNVQRIIQQPVMLQTMQVCSPAEQARQRIKDVGTEEEKQIGTVTVEAGHGEVNVTDNHGEINNSVNVQVVNQNERSCL